MSDPSNDSGALGDDDWVSQMLAESLLDGSEPILLADEPIVLPADPVLSRPVQAETEPGHGVLGGETHQGLARTVDAQEVHPPPSHRSVATIGDGSNGPIGDDPDIEFVDPTPTASSEGGGGGGDDEADQEDDDHSSFGRFIGEWVVVLLGAVAFALVLRVALFQAFWIPSESMEETLQLQDRVLVNKISYRLHDVNRGDVVVFRRPDDEQAEIRDLIKRVIGLPGETIEGRDNAIWIDGRRLEESYLADDEVILPFGPVTVEEGHVFVMGDNRDMSLDSRFFGAVPEERIVGRAFVLFWPIDRVGFL